MQCFVTGIDSSIRLYIYDNAVWRSGGCFNVHHLYCCCCFCMRSGSFLTNGDAEHKDSANTMFSRANGHFDNTSKCCRYWLSRGGNGLCKRMWSKRTVTYHHQANVLIVGMVRMTSGLVAQTLGGNRSTWEDAYGCNIHSRQCIKWWIVPRSRRLSDLVRRFNLILCSVTNNINTEYQQPMTQNWWNNDQIWCNAHI